MLQYHKDKRRWGSEEDRVLCDTYPVGGITAAEAALPQRSYSSIIGRAKRLGLGRAGTDKITYWTGVDELKLKRLWKNGPKHEIELVLPNRSWPSITSKARKLGLFRNVYIRRPLSETKDPMLNEIRNRMIVRGFTSTDLQEVSGLKRGCTRNWFNGRAQPKLQNIMRAVEALDGELIIRWRQE